MDREAFKQRMQSLKSYRENNPGKGYLDWKASLPDNLQDESSYNLQRAYELGYEPEYIEEDRSYHLPTRDQETGEILMWEELIDDAIGRHSYDNTIVPDTEL